MANHQGTRWRGNLDAPRALPHVRAFAEIANEQRTTLTEIGKRAGLSRHSLGQWLAGQRRPTVDHLEAALNALGYELQVRKRREQEARP